MSRAARRGARSPARHRALAALTVLALAGASTLRAAADQVPPPAQWPASADLAPTMGSNAHALRISGGDRYQTNLAAALTLRGQGGYPFSSPDRAAGWWGAGTCPGAVIVVAGDSTADALAAAPLSDPTDQSSEPQLQISATADPSFFGPVGAIRRVDTDSAPILLTRSTREGSAGLSATAQTAAFDFAQGACAANEAIVVGGTSSVPAAVDQQLIALGYDRVFRAAGPDRFATAAAIAKALGTGPAEVSACPDPDSTDGSTRTRFLGNAAIELRSGPTDCALLTRTVVLADGIVGADALAAGWWTSMWQVPVLLTGPDGTLPPATRDALSLLSLQIDNLIVLGGTARIGDATVAEAAALASATPRRVAGPDRYATSVQMARSFGGWHATGDGADFAGSMACLAASGGNGAASSPDALGAGPWCAAVSGAAGGPGAPSRATAPVAGPASALVPAGVRPAHDLVPILLVPPGASALPSSVSALLGATFDPSAPWCSGTVAPAGCSVPGFAIGFGGAAALTAPALAEAARHVSGGSYTSTTDLAPALGPVNWTQLEMGPVFHRLAGAAPGAHQACVGRGAMTELRWLGVWDDANRALLRAAADTVSAGIYRVDADGSTHSPGTSAPTCTGLGSGGSTPWAGGVSLSGHPTGTQVLDLDHRLSLDPAIDQAGPEASTGAPSSSTTPGDVTELTFSADPAAGTSIVVDGAPTAVSSATLRLRLARRPTPTGADTFTGTATLITASGTFTFDLTGEGIFDEQIWRLRGRSDLRNGPGVIGGAGGVTADLDTGPSPGPADDTVRWDLDALINTG